MLSLICLLHMVTPMVSYAVPGAMRAQAGIDPPAMPREFRAAWVATVDNIDWPSARGLTTDQMKDEMIRILDTAVKIKLNAIIFQVRPASDALYESKLEPWSEYLTGTQGKAPDPLFDPLKFAVEEAHKRGLELHCWFNPYRAGLHVQRGPYSSRHVSRSYPSVVKQYGSFLWMDPGEPFVQQRTLAVIKDVVKRYDIDGVHIDDYFYPYPEGGKEFPDDPSYHRYTTDGGTLSRDDWRRENVNSLVHNIYKEIKAEKPWVKFGISPFGIYRPGIPDTIKAGIDQYAELYADCKKWLNEGWCDYMSPQLYWPIAQRAQSFPTLLDWWIGQNTMGRHIWPGLYTSRVTGDGGKSWNVREILDQIGVTREKSEGAGEVHFSMKVFLEDRQHIDSALSNGLYADRALVPASPWLGEGAPAKPQVSFEGGRLEIKPGSRHPVRFYTIRVKTDRWLQPRVTSDSDVTLSSAIGAPVTEIAVRAIDRVGNASEATIVMPVAQLTKVLREVRR